MNEIDLSGVFQIEVDPSREVEIFIPEDVLVEIGTLILEEIRKNAKSGIDAQGKVRKDSKGKKIDWRDSGQMLDDARADDKLPGLLQNKSAQEVAVVFFAEYASFVNDQYPFLGLNPGSLERVTQKIQRLLEQKAVLREATV